MNVVCFRYRRAGLNEAELGAINSELLVRLQESGIAVPSNARINRRFAIRVANTNYRTVRSDFESGSKRTPERRSVGLDIAYS